MNTGDDGLALSYATDLEPLTAVLAGLDRSGDYFTAGLLESAPPLLEIHGAGLLSFPVPPGQARDLIKAAGVRAPYGRGEETIVDETIRKVWQIAPDKIQLGGRQWPRALDCILEAVTAGLGRPEGSLRPELYKLLVYDEGGFFLPHRDTEKAPGMLGTLIVALPSAHEGGELVIRHHGRETVQELRNVDPGLLAYAAFYADCEHEVRPVLSGHRICLVYNLVAAKPGGLSEIAVPDTRPHVEKATGILRKWAGRSKRSEKIVYLLDHRYTEAALSLAALKGGDAAIAEVLFKAAAEADFSIHLGMVHIEESGWAEYTGYYQPRGGHRRRWEEDDEDEEEEYEIGEVCDERRFIAQWRDAADRPVNLAEIPLQDDEVLPVGALRGEAPDALHFSEATGNEGASFERTYLRAAVVLWPRDSFDVICASAGFDSTLARLEQRAAELAAAPASDEPRSAVGLLAKRLVENWPLYRAGPEHLERAITALVRCGQAGLLAQHLSPVLDRLLPRRIQPLLAWAELAGPEGFDPIAERLLRPASEIGAIGAMQLWTGLAGIWATGEKGADRLDRMLPSVFRQMGRTAARFAFPGMTEKSPASDPNDGPFETDEDFEEAEAILLANAGAFRHGLPTPVVCPPEVLADFLEAVERGPGGGRVGQSLDCIIANPLTFSVLESILPALEGAASGAVVLGEKTKASLWRLGANHLLGCAETPPPPPRDWRLPLSSEQLAKLPRELNLFAIDPEAKVLRLKMAAALRQQFQAAINQQRLDITCATEHRGRPYTLVCTKTLGHYERACEAYRKDYDGLRRFLALAAFGSDALAERLRTALAAGKSWKPVPAEAVVRPS
ncbi:MAG: 2OG-Fe(II) oxygenase [Puniceicoccaceae bacterium]|nr:MAG: 2OG-Fe(II) oxygenase [Puniceicoccaceae bacterium]